MIKNSIITSDLHCANWKPFGISLSDGFNSRLQQCLNVLDEIFTYAEQNKATNVFILGDLFHTRGRVETTVYDIVYKTIKSKAEQGFSIYLLVGNHDQATKAGEIHALLPFQEIVNVTIIDTPQLLGNVYFVPYSEHIDIENFKKTDYLLGHFGVSGAVVGSSNYVIGETVTLKHLKDYKKVFLGHFHKNQVLGNTYLPGAPLQHTFGDREDTKGFYHIDENYNVKFIETTAPKFKSVDVANTTDVTGFEKDDYVQFVIKSKKVKAFDFSKVSSNYKTTLDLPKNFEERLEIKSEESDVQILENYLQKFREPLLAQGLNLEKMKILGKRIWEKYEQDTLFRN